MIFLLIFLLLAYFTKECSSIGLPLLLIYSFILCYAFPVVLLFFGAVFLVIIIKLILEEK